MTVVSALLEKYSIPPTSIGRLEVGTETLLDKSKSVKTILMQLFEASGNTDIEGVDTVNACYGGTSALFNAVNWIQSCSWDGRDAIVVAGDIAVYSKGPARPTGGAGIVAMLVGSNAPLELEPQRGSYMKHAYDFYKPNLASEYPVVDGHFSNECYTRAVDACYKAYSTKTTVPVSGGQLNGKINGHSIGLLNGHGNHKNTVNGVNPLEREIKEEKFPLSTLESFDYMCFHSPNTKLVAKSYARLFYNDYLSCPTAKIYNSVPPSLSSLPYEASLTDKTLEKHFMELSKSAFGQSVKPGTLLPKMCGNMYTASLYSSLASLLFQVSSKELQGKRIGMFSYGSGLASSMFSLKVVGDTSKIAAVLNLTARLEERTVVSPEIFEKVRLPQVHSFLLGRTYNDIFGD